jgi:L-2-hydroxycarboxylate dehydrogenase (NAD+)
VSRVLALLPYAYNLTYGYLFDVMEMRVQADELTRLGVDMLMAAGATVEEAEVVTEILVDTSLRGIDSHGVRALPRYIRNLQTGEILSGAPIEVLKDTPTTAMWDTDLAFGFVAAKKAMEAAIAKAERYRVGLVGYMGKGHIGALYYYTTQAVKRDMIGIVLQRGNRHLVAPYGGVEGRLGTNPFAVGIPAGEERPILLDLATNAVATGHFLLMRLKGETVPEGWLIDRAGRWVHEYDDEAAVQGRIAPVSFGGTTNEYKGYGIKIILEALCGAIGVGCSLDENGFGCLFTAIDPAGFCAIEDFKARVDALIRHVKSSSKRPGVQEILLPGEPEFIEMEKRLRDGIPVDAAFWTDIVQTAGDLGINVCDYFTLETGGAE